MLKLEPIIIPDHPATKGEEINHDNCVTTVCYQQTQEQGHKTKLKKLPTRTN